MTGVVKSAGALDVPQCQFFVVRKKRLCRMTVRPGRQYCGEHEPQPKTVDGQADRRVPCPNDPKHTCYLSKLEKHLAICNARPSDLPPYIVTNINSPTNVEVPSRVQLSKLPIDTLTQAIDKVNFLYNKYVKDNITMVTEHPIHSAVSGDFNEPGREESSLRHLRQASSLLWLAEEKGLVADKTCYVELGAGKGQLSYYACCAWCSEASDSCVLLVDRASLRHKRDNKLSDRAVLRIRADLAHLALHRVDQVAEADAVVGFAKHLCGVATDYALRCITGDGVAKKTRGVVLATCCHHRCENAGYIANKQLQELGISNEDLNAMLGIVSWATCGDGLSRERRNHIKTKEFFEENVVSNDISTPEEQKKSSTDANNRRDSSLESNCENSNPSEKCGSKNHIETTSGSKDLNVSVGSKLKLTIEHREQVGRNAKALLDWGRILYLRERGYDATLCYYVPTSVSLENMCIVAKRTEFI